VTSILAKKGKNNSVAMGKKKFPQLIQVKRKSSKRRHLSKKKVEAAEKMPQTVEKLICDPKGFSSEKIV